MIPGQMLKTFAKTLLKLAGWELKIELPAERKFVLIGAPHTSNWDFPLALLTFWTLDLKIFWVAKHQMFWGPLYYLFSALGGIPVDRRSSNGFIAQIAERFAQRDEMVLASAPGEEHAATEPWTPWATPVAPAVPHADALTALSQPPSSIPSPPIQAIWMPPLGWHPFSRR